MTDEQPRKGQDAELDEALDDSMDASDPVSATPPDDDGEPAKSSGYDEKAEKALKNK